jgi:lysophospholipase L1-like esterase
MQPANRTRSLRGPSFGQRQTVAAAAAVIAVVGLVAAIIGGTMMGGSSASPAPSGSMLAHAAPSPTAAILATGTPLLVSASGTVAGTPSPTARATPPVPSLLAAIGDSYSQGYSVSPTYRNDHPGFSWVVGQTRKDGVFSLYERFRAIGGSPVIVDAATSGKKMNDGPRQANLVVTAAAKLKPGQTAYVTFELGTNDLCDDPKTDPTAFQQDLATAIATLRAGLPDGSRILMLPVPDFRHFRDITQANPVARANLALPQNSNRCAPYLGDNSPSTLAQADDYLTQYDAALQDACREIAASDAPSGKLDCTYDAALLGDADFRIADLSTVDFFHPSLSGQAKMAASAWTADAWAKVPIPKGANQ